jgi:hypothetical protein
MFATYENTYIPDPEKKLVSLDSHNLLKMSFEKREEEVFSPTRLSRRLCSIKK